MVSVRSVPQKGIRIIKVVFTDSRNTPYIPAKSQVTELLERFAYDNALSIRSVDIEEKEPS